VMILGKMDGDFERDPMTGSWVEGEGSAIWESRAGVDVSYRMRTIETSDERPATNSVGRNKEDLYGPTPNLSTSLETT